MKLDLVDVLKDVGTLGVEVFKSFEDSKDGTMDNLDKLANSLLEVIKDFFPNLPDFINAELIQDILSVAFSIILTKKQISE